MDVKYSPKDIENKIYNKWLDNNCFSPKDLKSNYSIVLPPPNVTGTLHMGHAFQHTIIDILIRYNRMLGKSVLWQPGTDHAGIATQLVVENNLAKKNITRGDIGRERLVEEIWKWKEESGNTIIQQTKRLGSSADWSRNRFTMDEGLSKAVRKVFIDLYQEKLIYKGTRLINWDIKLQTAISDLEVTNIEKEGYLYYLKYKIKNMNEHIVVATTRPETLFGDVAICINPNDKRFNHLIDKKVIVPLINREIPIIEDETIDVDFGTGCVKVTPGHDFNDFNLGKKYKLDSINILNKDGTFNDNVDPEFVGKNIHESRDKIVNKLKSQGFLEKIAKYKTTVPIGERSGEIIEPLITSQWFMNMKELARPAIEAIENSTTKIIPKNWEKIYFNWLNNIEDWCLSRQIWWGHRIPAWYDDEDNIYVGEDESEVRRKYNIANDIVLYQDNDVLDTWFSSALWPFSTMGWPKDTDELKKYYPTTVLVTGFDIIFFWVARMMMMGLKFLDKVPFKTIYIHGLVRDSEGKKMSKSIGNVIDPIDIIDGIKLSDLKEKRTSGMMQPKIQDKIIKKTEKEFPEGIKSYGADALRFCFCALASTGRDINFDLQRIEGYRNFCNKLWNASRFVFITTKNHAYEQKIVFDKLSNYEKYLIINLDRLVTEYKKHCTNYRFDLMASSLYSFIWNEYCDWFLEISKTTENRPQTNNLLIYTLQIILKLCHPIIPYITEEIWLEMKKRMYSNEDILMNSKFPSQQKVFHDNSLIEEIDIMKEVVTSIRKVRSDLNIHPQSLLSVNIASKDQFFQEKISRNSILIEKLAKTNPIKFTEDQPNLDNYITVTLKNTKIYLYSTEEIDVESETKRLTKKLKNLDDMLYKIDSKLGNKNFIEKAPSEIIKENTLKKENIENEIKIIRELLVKLSN